jgi:hypothetical protein
VKPPSGSAHIRHLHIAQRRGACSSGTISWNNAAPLAVLQVRAANSSWALSSARQERGELDDDVPGICNGPHSVGDRRHGCPIGPRLQRGWMHELEARSRPALRPCQKAGTGNGQLIVNRLPLFRSTDLQLRSLISCLPDRRWQASRSNNGKGATAQPQTERRMLAGAGTGVRWTVSGGAPRSLGFVLLTAGPPKIMWME